MRATVPALALALALSACTNSDDGRSGVTLPAPTTAEPATDTSAAAPSPSTTAAPAPTTAVPPVTEPPTTFTTAPPPPAAEAQEHAVPPPGAGAGDSFYPWLGNSGYDVTHYDLALDVDPDANAIDGVTTVHAVSTSELEAIYLDLSGLEVSTVKVDGTAAEFSRQDAELIVQPSAPVPAGVSFTLEVAYSGTPERIDDPGVPFVEIGWFNEGGVIFTANEPSGSMSWFPANNHPTDKATYTIAITVPERLTAASNGLLTSETVADGRRTATWQMNDPMATYLAAVYIGEFERHEQETREGLLIRDYIPSSLTGEERQATLEALSVTPGAIEFFEELLGPYPFDAYGTLVLPFRTGFAMENQTLSLHGNQTLNPLIIGHELAHAWFGNSVSPGDWSDIWLNEGFAHYLAFLYLADYEGSDIGALMAQELQAARDANAVPPASVTLEQLFDFNSVYRRSTLSLHALHRHLGDETFFEVVRRHYQQSAGGSATTPEFMAIVAQLGGPEAVALLASWLYSPEMPSTLDDLAVSDSAG
ncbi:M1 family metallopeptidase [Candidatus Poriferisodalis sp.]|uniref:M1 family metallopeptidase n=1 Tax=Candidatus Poriferisodalis sp. TaxID=3101277 RepID=UPI003B012831